MQRVDRRVRRGGGERSGEEEASELLTSRDHAHGFSLSGFL